MKKERNEHRAGTDEKTNRNRFRCGDAAVQFLFKLYSTVIWLVVDAQLIQLTAR